MKKFAVAVVLSMLFAVPAFATKHPLKHPKPAHPQQRQHYAKRPKATHQQQHYAKRPKAIHPQDHHLTRPLKHHAGPPSKHHLHFWPFHKKR